MVSPGGEAQSGAKRVADSVMVVTYEFDVDGGHLRPVGRAVARLGYWVIGGCENQPVTAGKVQRKLAGAIGLERMRVPCREVGNDAGGSEVSEAGTQLACTGVSQLPARNLLLFAQVAQFAVLEIDLQNRHPEF